MGENAGTTIKDYARSRGVTHEAVRRQIKRYAEELEGHITLQGRTKYLDSVAVEFLDKHRLPKTVVLEPMQGEIQKEIEGYRKEIERLNRVIEKHSLHIITLSERNNKLIEYQAENRLLIEQKERDQEQIQNIKESLQAKDTELLEVRKELQEAQQEASSYQRTWFGLYKKV